MSTIVVLSCYAFASIVFNAIARSRKESAIRCSDSRYNHPRTKLTDEDEEAVTKDGIFWGIFWPLYAFGWAVRIFFYDLPKALISGKSKQLDKGETSQGAYR